MKPWLSLDVVDEIPEVARLTPGRKSPWAELFQWGLEAEPGTKVRLALETKSKFDNAVAAITRWNHRNRDKGKLVVYKDKASLVLYLEKVQPKSL